jgi:histone H3/H4
MYEDDSFDEAPPRMSILPDLPDDADTGTMHSLELGRRAFSEDPRAMYAGRISEHFGDLSALGLDGEEYEIDGTFINRRPAMDPDQILQEDIEEGMEDTGEIRALTGRRDGRPSDVDLGIFGDMDEPDEPTFRFTIPQRIRAPIQEEEPMDEDEEAEANAQDYEDVEAGAELDADLGPTTGDENEATARSGVTGWESEHDGEDDPELQAYREEESALDRSLHSLQAQSPEQPAAKANQAKRQRRTLNISRAGHEYPSFPAATVKRIATGLAKSQGGNAKISKDTLAALVQTTDWFFEQIGEDLAAYAQHAGRKVIEEADMVALMKRYVRIKVLYIFTWIELTSPARQRLITKNTTAFSLAQKMLPRELLQELRMQPVGKLKRQKRKRMEAIPEEEEEEA